jgi:hypothetical protein
MLQISPVIRPQYPLLVTSLSTEKVTNERRSKLSMFRAVRQATVQLALQAGFNLSQATKALRQIRGIALLYL